MAIFANWDKHEIKLKNVDIFRKLGRGLVSNRTQNWPENSIESMNTARDILYIFTNFKN